MIRSKFVFRNILFLGFVGMLSACSQKSTQPTTAKPSTTESNTQTSIQSSGQEVINAADYQLGLEALASRDYARAKRLFQGFIKSNPNLAGAYINLALISFRDGDIKSAEKLVNQAIDLNPQQAQAYHLRAQVYIENSQIKLARQDYQKAIELRPGYINAHYNLALLYDIFMQEIALAIDHYKMYLSLLDKEDEKTRNWIKHLQNTLNNG